MPALPFKVGCEREAADCEPWRVRDWLLSRSRRRAPPREEVLAVLVYVARTREVSIDEEARRRRSGGPYSCTRPAATHRELTLDARAGETLGADLDSAERRAQLGRGLAAIRDEAARLPFVRETLGPVARRH